MSATITRKALKTAIEAGLAETLMAEEGVKALRNVGESAERVAIGTFWDARSACGCPLTQAGIYYVANEEGGTEISAFGIKVNFDSENDNFWDTFDRVAIDLANDASATTYTTTYKVID